VFTCDLTTYDNTSSIWSLHPIGVPLLPVRLVWQNKRTDQNSPFMGSHRDNGVSRTDGTVQW